MAYSDIIKEMESLKGFKLINDFKMLEITQKIFTYNYNSLCYSVDRFEQDIELCFSINSSKRDEVTFVILRSLHNYLASAFTLVNHTRKLKQKLNNEKVNVFYDKELEKLKSTEVVAFVKDFRNYIQHRSLPICSRSLHFETIEGTSQCSLDHKILLNREELLKWRKGSKSKWTSKSKKYLNRFDSNINIKLFCKEYYDTVINFDKVFFEMLLKEYETDIKELKDFQEHITKLYPPQTKAYEPELKCEDK